MNILLLNQTFHPDVAATAQQASDLAVAVAQRGHDVTVVCGRRSYDNPTERHPRHEVWRGVSIRRISSLGLGKTTRWRRAADFGSFVLNCLVHLSALGRFDLVIAMTSPPLISWLGALFTKIRGGRFIFWVMDLNPDEALAAGWLRSRSTVTRILNAMLMLGLRCAQTVVVMDRFMASRIERKGINPRRITVIPPWPLDHLVRYDCAGRDRFRKDHGVDGRFVVMYAGNHSPCHPLTTLLEAARCLRERFDIVFTFIGGGSEFQSVRRYAASHRLQNIVTIPYQPLAALAASLSAADLHVVVMGDRFVGIVHPSKVYNIRLLGIPYLYIGPSVSHVADLRPAFSARHGDVDMVARHIQAAATGAGIEGRIHTGMTLAASREQLMTRMVLTLEDAASRSPLVLHLPDQRSARLDGQTIGRQP